MSTPNSMIAVRGLRIDNWLAAGGVVLASNERLARSLRGIYNRRREGEGLAAWPTPRIFEWKSFVRQQWDQLFTDGRMILSPLQEEWLFARIMQNSTVTAATLHGPRMRLASLAREAHELLCSYAPDYLDTEHRSAWPGDTDAFHQWLSEFEATCQSERWLSSARIPLEAIAALACDDSRRDALLLAGFDRLTPAQTRFFEAWGPHEVLSEEDTAARTQFYAAKDAASEVAACALWCRQMLEADPKARLLVISQDAPERRGEIERAFSRFLTRDSATASLVEFSMGIPLADTPLVQGALLILRWISQKPLAENEVDWLLSAGLTAESEYETACLQKQMKSIRRRNLQRPEWTLESFINAKPGGIDLPQSWSRRMLGALRRIEDASGRRSALEWAEILPLGMKDAGWPGSHPMTSANFQVLDHWNKTIDACATLGFDERPISWRVFHSAIARELDDALFSPESSAGSILITAPVQSAGLVADGIWFLGAEEDSWPFSGKLHQFLPQFVQREAIMPHCNAKVDADLARSITDRLLRSAPEVCFSYSQLRDKSESNPSHMLVAVAGLPGPLPLNLVPDILPARQTVEYMDGSNVPYGGAKAEGGSHTLTLQSQCAFRAFATARLDAKTWEAAETGLNPRQRGDLVHGVLRSVWGGPKTNGWTSSDELRALLDSSAQGGIESFVLDHVKKAMNDSIPATLRDRLPTRYLAIEESRLVKVISEWLTYESRRASFTVKGTEEKASVVIAGLSLDLRLDRQDELEDGSNLVVDYKTGEASPDRWATERPEDVQLPIYASFAVNKVPGSDPGGLVFAKVKAGSMEFAGRLRDPLAVLPTTAKTSSLVKNPLTDEQLEDWRGTIEGLAIDFLNGRADVNPRDSEDTCENCKLSMLCRIEERREVAV
jgi:ATP-dependent helicase/nuclease subunit B